MTNLHPRLARLIAVGTTLVLTAGCSVAVTTGSPTNPPGSAQPANPTAAAPSTSAPAAE